MKKLLQKSVATGKRSIKLKIALETDQQVRLRAINRLTTIPSRFIHFHSTLQDRR